MGNTKKKKQNSTVKIAAARTTKDYINDPYFVKKREIAITFLKKVGLPPTFSKPQG
jgi:hypothetical protein